MSVQSLINNLDLAGIKFSALMDYMKQTRITQWEKNVKVKKKESIHIAANIQLCEPCEVCFLFTEVIEQEKEIKKQNFSHLKFPPKNNERMNA